MIHIERQTWPPGKRRITTFTTIDMNCDDHGVGIVGHYEWEWPLGTVTHIEVIAAIRDVVFEQMSEDARGLGCDHLRKSDLGEIHRVGMYAIHRPNPSSVP